MGYSFGLLPGRNDPSTQSYPIALPRWPRTPTLAKPSVQHLAGRGLLLKRLLQLSHSYTILNPVNDEYFNPSALDCAYELARKGVQIEPKLPQAQAAFAYVLIWKGEHDTTA
jgi:hypothetical protein